MVLTTTNLELTAKVSQLEEKLRGKDLAASLVLSLSPTPKMLGDDQLLGLSNWVLAAKTLEHAYLYDHEVFFLLMDVEQAVTLTAPEFEIVAKHAKAKGLENLFVEILIRGNLTVEDYAQAYWKFGDLGVRSFLYRWEAEKNQAQRRQMEPAMAKLNRRICCTEWIQPILEGFDSFQRLSMPTMWTFTPPLISTPIDSWKAG